MVKVHSNNHEHRSNTLLYYRVLVPTFQLHHQTLKIVRGQSTSQDDFCAMLANKEPPSSQSERAFRTWRGAILAGIQDQARAAPPAHAAVHTKL
ncbi:hypothetical protein EVAR_68741_1 [Eumeta japonica]|uniref:Uncharacterized protein n=1 Tax=Eumeta variegata TaxID=151549 RepID=A0A4C1ZMK2_EUMVA|nr:hypothetical protein EVAR_68741_1 [Eumeta japonica]